MIEQMFQYFTSFYTLPKASPAWIIFAIGLALVYGSIWIAAFWPPLFKKWQLWLVIAGSIVLPTIALPFIQFPLQYVVSESLVGFLSSMFQQTAVFLITGIIMVIISGLVLQGALLIPVFYYWGNLKQEVTPRFALMLGALSGAVFGMFQAYQLFGKFVEIGIVPIMEANPISMLAFFERFLGIAFFAGTTALAAYGLAKGKGWQAYLVFAGVNAVYSYMSLLLTAKILNLLVVEIILSLITLAAIGLALWLYWKKIRTEEKSA